jgi:hypothetical protein
MNHNNLFEVITVVSTKNYLFGDIARYSELKIK